MHIITILIKYIKNPALLFDRFRFHITQTAVVMTGFALLTIFLISVLMWDGYLFMQSITPPTAAPIQKSKKISLVAQDIDEAIHILDVRQEKFNTLLKATTGTSTNLF